MSTYDTFGRGVAVRWNRSKGLYEVLVRGAKTYTARDRREAYDHAAALLGDGEGE